MSSFADYGIYAFISFVLGIYLGFNLGYYARKEEEEQCKEKYEVGDIWAKKGSSYRFVITNLGTKDNTWISRLWSNGYADSFPPESHLEYYHYFIGKSKTNIDILFDEDKQ